MLSHNIVITGASAGIGSVLAEKYAGKGVVLGLIGRDLLKLESVAAQCRKKGAEVIIGQVDVRDSSAMESWILHFDQKHPVDLLIANAGVTSHIGPSGEPEPWLDVKKVIDTNLYGVLGAICPLIPPMQQRKHGHMVLISSLAAYRGMPLTPAYCASKAAVKSYGEALRGWLVHDGVKVTVVCPGFVESDMSKQFPGKKPFMISAEKAADIIWMGVAHNKACVSFPFPLNLGSWFLSVLPSALVDKIMQWFDYGARR